MMLRNRYTTEIHEIVLELRRTKTNWSEIVRIINSKYPDNLYNYNSLRKAYFYYLRNKEKREEKNTLSDIVLERIKERFSKNHLKITI